MLRRTAGQAWVRRALWVLFVLYGLLLLQLLLLRDVPLAELFSAERMQGMRRMNLVPLRTLISQWDRLLQHGSNFSFINLGGNIGMFVPLGLLLPVLFCALRRVYITLPLGILASMAFEFCQYRFYLGSLDVDDVILNAVGVLLGYFCWYLLYKCAKNDPAREIITLVFLLILCAGALIAYRGNFGALFLRP